VNLVLFLLLMVPPTALIALLAPTLTNIILPFVANVQLVLIAYMEQKRQLPVLLELMLSLKDL